MNRMIYKVLVMAAVVLSVSVFAQNSSVQDKLGSKTTATTAHLAGLPGRLINKEGSFLRQVEKRDSVLIADQLDYGFVLEKVKEGTALALPEFKGTGIDSVLSIVRGWTLDTLEVYRHGKNEPKEFDIEVSVRLAAFNPGKYSLPQPAAVLLTEESADTLLFDNKEMRVCSIPVDTATFNLHDIKGQVRYPLTFGEILPYIGGSILIVSLLAALIYFLKRYLDRAGKKSEPEKPAHITALSELDKYRSRKYWAAENQKVFYSGVTDALRAYITSRYGFSAMEMTTPEIFDNLKKTDLQAALYEEIHNLFETSDFVKFAKLTVSDEENAKVVPVAVKFVMETYRAQLDLEVERAVESDKVPETGNNVKI